VPPRSRGIFEVEDKDAETREKEKLTSEPSFWNDPKRAQEILKLIKSNKTWVASYYETQQAVDDAGVLLDFFRENEVEMHEVDKQYAVALKKVDELEFKSTLNNPEDQLSALVEINSGAGGTESCDWAEMLMRMYLMWGEKSGYKVTQVDLQQGEVAGIKSATLEISGEFAYGYLKGENGVHRLVRISPYDSNQRRHTSFASVFVYPVIDDTIEIEVNPSDLDWDTFRSSGKGGQNVNKVETAVRVRHFPSGIVVECQETRSQHQNREKAVKILKSRLYEVELRKKNEAREKVESGKMKIEWGSQIRSYVLHPYKLVKDVRTGHETSNAQGVLDGNLDDFIKAFLMNKTVVE